MTISVVIPVYNSQNTIQLCLDGLLTQDRLPDEVIIVDNGSRDKSVALINESVKKFPSNVKVIIGFEGKKGPAAARNKGIAATRGEIIAFLDSDCIPRRDWIANILKRFETDPSLGGIGGVSEGYNPSNSLEKFISSFRCLTKEPAGKSLSDVSIIVGCFIPTLNAAYRKNLLLSVGLFDDTYFLAAGEDVDLYLRAIKKGYQMKIWCKEIKVKHVERGRLSLYIRQIMQYRMAEARIIKAHFYEQLTIVLPFGAIFHKDRFLTVWIESLAVCLGAAILFLAVIVYPEGIYYYLTALIGFAFIDNAARLKKAKISADIVEIFAMSFILLLQKILSPIAKIYSSLKYRIIFL